MRRTLLAAASLAGALAGGVARADDPAAVDMRCVVVAGSLSQSEDPDLKKLGEVSLLYFWGRLQVRETGPGLVDRVADVAAKMSADDVRTQAPTCGAMVSAAGADLQSLGAAVQQRLGASPPPK